MSARERGSQRNREGTPVDSSPPGIVRRSPHPRGMNASRRGMSCKQLPIACRDVRVDAWASVGTIRFPSGLKLTLQTISECPLSVSVSWPVWASQTFVLSLAAADDPLPVGAETHAHDTACVSLRV